MCTAAPRIPLTRGLDHALLSLGLLFLFSFHTMTLFRYDNILKWITKPDTFTLMLSARQVDGFGSPGESVQVVLRTAEASTISTAMMKQIGNLLKN